MMKPDVVLLFLWTTFFFLMNRVITAFVKCKTFCLCYNVLPYEESFIDKLLTKIALKKGDSFIIHGKKEKQSLLKLFEKISEKRIAINEHPSYSCQFNDTKISHEDAKKKLGLKNRVILFFGFVRKYKELQYLIDAISVKLI